MGAGDGMNGEETLRLGRSPGSLSGGIPVSQTQKSQVCGVRTHIAKFDSDWNRARRSIHTPTVPVHPLKPVMEVAFGRHPHGMRVVGGVTVSIMWSS